jgi:hypothetical protein
MLVGRSIASDMAETLHMGLSFSSHMGLSSGRKQLKHKDF